MSSNQLSKLSGASGERLFTEKEFKQASRLEKIRMHLLQPELYLCDRDLTYEALLIDAFRLSRQCMSAHEAIKKIQALEVEPMTYTRAGKILQDSETLFSPLVYRNKEIIRALIIERADALSKKAEADGRLKDAIKALELIAKVEALRAEDSGENILKELEMPDIAFTNNSKALAAQDVEFTEIADDEQE